MLTPVKDLIFPSLMPVFRKALAHVAEGVDECPRLIAALEEALESKDGPEFKQKMDALLQNDFLLCCEIGGDDKMAQVVTFVCQMHKFSQIL